MQEPPRGAGETVLVVEDDFEVRRLATIQLRSLGYVVLDAEDGPSGLRLLAEHPEIDVLLTDVILPGEMSGSDLSERALEARPNLPIVYMSGYTGNAELRARFVDRQDRLMTKPFRQADLARKIREALDARGRR